MTTLAEKIDVLLPQTQCTQCGYAGCQPYAEAIAVRGEQINRCPPGGDAGIAVLATLLGREVLALDASRGQHLPHRIAIIDATACIGCAKCLPPCPTDAIIGASKQLHVVIAALCTGCELCIAPCPVDCIRMEQSPAYPQMMPRETARQRFRAHTDRLAREAAERDALLAARERAVLGQSEPD